MIKIHRSKKIEKKTIEFLKLIKTTNWDDLLNVFQIAERQGIHITKADYYSPIPIVYDLNDEIFVNNKNTHIDWNDKLQQELLVELSSYSSEFRNIVKEKKYDVHNDSFSYHDAPIYYCMIRHFKPKRIIEIGAGNSTKLAYQASNKTVSITTIDPFISGDFYNEYSNHVTIIKKPVQSIPVSFFEELSLNDILFIDSSHVSKINSDVNFLFLEVLPVLKPGVIVHIHDIFLPRTYPKKWLEENLLFWNEQYILNALLIGNKEYEVILANYYLSLFHPDLLCQFYDTDQPPGGGSFWMRKKINDKN